MDTPPASPWLAVRRWRDGARDRARALWSGPIESPWTRVRAWTSLLVFDHGLLRPVYWNSGAVTPQVWRGPQPNPFHIADLARRGVRTLVNLRGATEYGSYALAREAAARHGLAFENAVLRSREPPRRGDVEAFDALLGRIAYPALLHCKSGADRAGLAAALYLILREEVPVEEARRQLSLRWGHVRAGRTGVLDAFFERYLMDTGGQTPFRTWLASYDPAAVSAEFRAGFLGSLLVDRLFRRE